MGIVDITLVVKKNLFHALLILSLTSIVWLIYYIGFVKMPEMFWGSERNMRLMMTQEQIDRLEMEWKHMRGYKNSRSGFLTDYQREQYEDLQIVIKEKKDLYWVLESAVYPDPLVSGSRGSN